MKKMFTMLGIVLSFFGTAQTTTVNYTASTAHFANPERGFYKYTDAHSSDYELISQSSLTNYRTSQNITLIFRYFYLDNFKNSSISTTYLNNMQTDFNRIRNAGLKAIIRFAYSDDPGESQLDASKAQILAHIQQLKPLLEENADVIAAMQAGFIGAWGEWYYTSQSTFGGWGYNQTNLTTANINHRKDIVDAILSALPSSRMVQIRYPKIKQQMFTTTTPLPPSQAFGTTSLARTAHHNDCFLSSNTDVGTYTNTTTEYPYMEQETKYLVMGGETCAVFTSRTNCTTAQEEMARFHWSYLNQDYHPGVINGWNNGGCMDEIEKNLGYRFELISGTFPQNINTTGTFPVTLRIKNVGYAAPYNKRDAYIVLKNITTNQVYPIKMNTDPRTWLGPTTKVITENLTVPQNLPAGNYKMYLHLPDVYSTLANKAHYAIRFANNNMWESTSGYNNLNHVLSANVLLATNENTTLDINMYPVPANNELIIELDGVEEYTVYVYNALGQLVNLNTTISGRKMTIDTQSLTNGMYFISFENGTTKDSRKFIVSH